MEKRNILIVDDCPTARKLLGYMVRCGGYYPVLAANGFDALEKLAQYQICLIITDLDMPQMDGIELVKAVRSGGYHKDTPIIMISSRPFLEEWRMKAQADVYLRKPLTTKGLIQLIKKLEGRVNRYDGAEYEDTGSR